MVEVGMMRLELFGVWEKTTEPTQFWQTSSLPHLPYLHIDLSRLHILGLCFNEISRYCILSSKYSLLYSCVKIINTL